MRFPARLIALTALITAALLALVGGTAGAHSDEGQMQIVTFEQVAPLAVSIEVGVTFVNDGHLAPDAAVQATLSGPEGASVGPVPLTGGGQGSGLYTAEVVLPAPGAWTVEVSSAEPESEATGSVNVSAEAAGNATVPPGAVNDQPAATGDPSGDGSSTTIGISAASGDEDVDLAEGRATDGDGDTEEDRSIGIIVIAAGAAIVIAGAVFAISRRKQTALQADGDSDIEVD